MKTKVCKNCLQLLDISRRDNGYSTCDACSKIVKAQAQSTQQQVPPLVATLKRELQAQADEKINQKEAERRQQNVEKFFDVFKKIKRT
jgi:hypothetical protein